MGVGKSKNLIRESCPIGHNEPSMCKIIYETIEKGEIKKSSGTGFFCEINDNNIPFKKALFTNNHVLNENRIEINKEIEFEYMKEMKKIKITDNRKVFTNKELDYTCIQIFETDGINKFFKIDKQIFNHRNLLRNQELFIFQYPNGGILTPTCGKIEDITDNKNDAII